MSYSKREESGGGGWTLSWIIGREEYIWETLGGEGINMIKTLYEIFEDLLSQKGAV